MLNRLPTLSLQRERFDREITEDSFAKYTTVSGFKLTVGAGEIMVPIAFPVWFIDRPAMSFGGELDVNEFVEDLAFPTISAVVVRWRKNKEDRPGGGFWIGAEVACVSTGKANQRLILHWSASGTALGGSPGISTTI